MSDTFLQADEWLQRGNWEAIEQFLSAPCERTGPEEAVALRLRGHVLWRDRDWPGVFAALETACQAAVSQRAWPLAIDCALDLARWSQSRENMVSARSYLERARRYADAASGIDDRTQARLALTIGRLAPDLEQTEVGAEWCARALILYERLGDVPGQVDALWNLAVCNTYIGRLLEASDQAQRGLRLHRVARLDPLRELYLLNLVAVIALARGNTTVGLETIQKAAPLAAEYPLSKPALYLADTEAGLWRQQGDLTAALIAHARVEATMIATGDEGYRPWFEMERSWTRLLAGESPARVRRALLAVGDLQEVNMRAYLNFYVALLDILEGRLDDALARLNAVRQQFMARGERLHVFAADLYLAHCLFLAGNYAGAQTRLAQGLSWAETMAVDGFALWWHPGILARVCIEALRADIHPRQAEIMIVRRLGDEATPGLLDLSEYTEPDVRQRARSVLTALDRGGALSNLEAGAEDSVRMALHEHLRKGRLSLSALAQLRARLEAGATSLTWQRIAVFGFYAGSDLERDKIADRLSLSEGAVKRHIAAIRAAFGVESAGGRDMGRLDVTRYAQAAGWTRRSRDFNARK